MSYNYNLRLERYSNWLGVLVHHSLFDLEEQYKAVIGLSAQVHFPPGRVLKNLV